MINANFRAVCCIIKKKVEEVSYPLGEDDRYSVACVADETKPRYSPYRGLVSSVTQASYTDESKDILNLNDDASSDSDGDVEEL